MYFCDGAELIIDDYKYAIVTLLNIYFMALEEAVLSLVGYAELLT